MHNTKLLKSEHLTIYFLTHFVFGEKWYGLSFCIAFIYVFRKSKDICFLCMYMSTKVKGEIKKGVCYMKYLRPPKNLIYSGSK